VHADCDFKYPLRFEDSVEVRLLVREKRERSLAYSFIFRKLNENPPRVVAQGTLVVACVRYDASTGGMTAVKIPDTICGKIEVAPSELLGS